MITLKITDEQWKILRIKLQRKYNHLTDEDLSYKQGDEQMLVDHLCKRLKRNKEYVIFTLSKGLQDLDSNRL